MADTVNAIMDSAERRIRAAGYHGFSYREVAADVGVKAASVHYHYPSKDALAAAVARRYNDRVVEAVERQTAIGVGIVGAWRNVFRDALMDGARMCLCGALGVTVSGLAPAVTEEVQRFFALGVESLVKGGLTKADAVRILAQLEGAILMASAHDDPSLFDAAADNLR